MATASKSKSLRQLITDRPFIGKGGFGEVYGPCFWEDKTCAVKRRMCEAMDYCEKEIQACKKWMLLDHKNLITAYDVSFDQPTFFIVMEFGHGGSLDKVLKSLTSDLPARIVNDWSIQIANGMEYLHENKIVHRDLKSPNVIIMERFEDSNPHKHTLKITDFEQIRDHDHTKTMTQNGTVAWMAPEVIGNGKFSKKSDVYSYGVVLWELATRKIPYKETWIGAIIRGKHAKRLKLDIENFRPDIIKQIHLRCMNETRSARPSFAEILRVLQDPPDDQLIKMWAEEGQQKTTTVMNDLPLEVLDIILLRSYLHCVLMRKPSRGKKDELIIKQLASVDFCWLSRVTKPRFKRRIWNVTSEFYSRLYKKVEILRNNRFFITENISTLHLIKHLKSADCLSDVKTRLICRMRCILKLLKSIADGGKGNSLRITRQIATNYMLSADLMHEVRLFDDAQLSNFINCIRQSNQNLARIAENGGAVIKTSIVMGNRYLARKLVTEFNILRAKKSWSRRSYLTDVCINELKDDDIEVLNSVLEREVVLWFWCKSQKGLTNLQLKLKPSNILIEDLTSYDVRSTAVSACKEQFNRNVVACELAIERVENVLTDTSVMGVTKLQKKIYILCRSDKRFTTVIWEFEDQIPFQFQNKIKIKECELSYDIVSSERQNCLYISDLCKKCIWMIRMIRGKDKQYTASEWLTGNFEPYMSMSHDGQLLIIERCDLSYLRIYGSDSRHVRVISLPEVIRCPYHAVETSAGDFIIIEEPGNDDDDSLPDESDRKPNWVIHQVTSDGQRIIRSSDLSTEATKSRGTWHLSLYSDDGVFVASSKVSLLRSNLTPNLTVDDEILANGEALLFYDDEKKQLLVCGIKEGVKVYRLTLK